MTWNWRNVIADSWLPSGHGTSSHPADRRFLLPQGFPDPACPLDWPFLLWVHIWGTLSTPRDQIPPTEAVSRAQPMPTECVTTESQPSSATCTPTTWVNDSLLLTFPRPRPRHTHTGCGEGLLGSRKRSGSILLPGGEESLLASAFKTSPMICDSSAQAGLEPGLPIILDTEPTTQLILSCADAPGAVTGEHTTGVNLVSYAADR